VAARVRRRLLDACVRSPLTKIERCKVLSEAIVAETYAPALGALDYGRASENGFQEKKLKL
jgi:hypothetical protein